MSVSFASTITHATAAASLNHGNLPTVCTEAMDVDRDGLPLSSAPSASQSSNLDAVDSSVNTIHTQTTEFKLPGLFANDEIPVEQDHPEPTRKATPEPAPAPLAEPSESSQEAIIEHAQEEQVAAPLSINPALTHNILSLYNLDPLVATVARTDSITGEKINKMRKSYEGQLKSMGLSGRNKSLKHDETKGIGLSELAAWPDEEWHNQKVMGKDVTKGFPDIMQGKLRKAMHLQPGKVPNNEFWEDSLGFNERVKASDLVKTAKNSAATAASPNGQPQQNGTRPSNPAPGTTESSQPSEPIRARRTTKRRRYDDGSFEGYGEGYGDDDMEVGYSSGESRSTRNSAGHRKRRKTKDYTNSPTDFTSRNNSFSANPPGITAYGR